jgi:glycerol-3-phosphate dehydrogenase
VNDGSSTEGKTSREHTILKTPHNVTFVAGGKYTTYRLMAEQIVDKILPDFAIDKRVQFMTGRTKDPINPAVTAESLRQSFQEVDIWESEYGITPQEAFVLAQRHGPEATTVLSEGCRAGLKNVWEMEARFAIKNTMCLHLRDFMLRRSPLFLSYPDHGHSLVPGIARVFQTAYGWTDARTKEEVELFLQHESNELGWVKKL